MKLMIALLFIVFLLQTGFAQEQKKTSKKKDTVAQEEVSEAKEEAPKKDNLVKKIIKKRGPFLSQPLKGSQHQIISLGFYSKALTADIDNKEIEGVTPTLVRLDQGSPTTLAFRYSHPKIPVSLFISNLMTTMEAENKARVSSQDLILRYFNLRHGLELIAQRYKGFASVPGDEGRASSIAEEDLLQRNLELRQIQLFYTYTMSQRSQLPIFGLSGEQPVREKGGAWYLLGQLQTFSLLDSEPFIHSSLQSEFSTDGTVQSIFTRSLRGGIGGSYMWMFKEDYHFGIMGALLIGPQEKEYLTSTNTVKSTQSSFNSIVKLSLGWSNDPWFVGVPVHLERTTFDMEQAIFTFGSVEAGFFLGRYF